MREEEVVVGVVAIVFGGAFAVAIVAIIASACRKILQTWARESSRREIAAYVAEGSISPDEAVRLMEAESGGRSRISELMRGRATIAPR